MTPTRDPIATAFSHSFPDYMTPFPCLVVRNEFCYSRIDLLTTPAQVAWYAVLPTHDHDGAYIYILDYKPSREDADKITVTYQIRNDSLAPIFTHTFPTRSEETSYQRPRGRGWEWSKYGGYWHNRKTGENREGKVP